MTNDLEAWVSGPGASLELAPQDCASRVDAAMRRLRRVWGTDTPIHVVDTAAIGARVAAGTGASFLSWVGRRDLERRPAVAVVGTRGVDMATARRIEAWLDTLAMQTRVDLVSGGALGVDTLAHRTWMRHGLPVTVVLAGGLAFPSPGSNREDFRQIAAADGAVVSDRPPLASPQSYDFVRRNRLIAALADVVVVAAAPVGSGALATAAYAVDLGRPVLVLPGAFDDPLFAGAAALLRRGARVCIEPVEIGRAHV